MKITAKLVFTADPVKALQKVKDASKRRILTKAIRAALKPLKSKVKVLAPKFTGALKISIGTVIRKYKGSLSVIGVVGPRSDWQQIRKGRNRRPAWYAHFSERQTPFLKPAHDSSKSQEVMREVIESEVARELSK